VAKAAGLLTPEAALHLVAASLLEEQQIPPGIEPEEEPPIPEDYTPSFVTAGGAKVGTALEYEVKRRLTAIGIDSALFKVTETNRTVIVDGLKFLADLWKPINENLEEIGFHWVKEGQSSHWTVSKKDIRIALIDLPETPTIAEAPPEHPSSIKEIEAALEARFPGSAGKLVVTEDAKEYQVEPRTKLDPDFVHQVTMFIAKMGGQQVDTGISPGYVWVILKG